MKIFGRSTVPMLLAAAAVPAWSGLSAQVQEQVEGGIAFKDACRILEEEYHSRDRL